MQWSLKLFVLEICKFKAKYDIMILMIYLGVKFVQEVYRKVLQKMKQVKFH